MVTAKFIQTIGVIDPDTNQQIEVCIYKEDAGGMFGVDASYIEQEIDNVISPFGNGTLKLSDHTIGYRPIGSKRGFIVLLLCVSSAQPIFREDEDLIFFDTAEEAQDAIQECIDDVKEAVKRGDMSDEYSLDDYEVCPATLLANGMILCNWEGDDYTIMRRGEDDWSKV